MTNSTKPAKPEGAGAPDANPSDGLLTVDEHAQAMFPPTMGKGSRASVVVGIHAERWKHASAASLHRWEQCEHHSGKPKRLTKENYVKALEAACSLNAKGVPTPHKPALHAEQGD